MSVLGVVICGISVCMFKFAYCRFICDFVCVAIGVDLDNYIALKLYAEAGFDRIKSVCDDEYGRFVKLLKML